MRNETKKQKTKKNEALSEFARSGGQATFKKYGIPHMKRMAKLAVKARWGK